MQGFANGKNSNGRFTADVDIENSMTRPYTEKELQLVKEYEEKQKQTSDQAKQTSGLKP